MSEIKKLLKALSDFQTEVPVIHHETNGFGYTYANLTSIFEVIKPLLKTHGIGFYQLLDGKLLKTVIFHIESGESIEGSLEIDDTVKLGGMNQYQVMGSAITYFRRYSLSCALGLITDKDVDAKGEEKKDAPQAKKKKPLNKKQFEAAKEGTLVQVANVLNNYEMKKDERTDLLVIMKELKEVENETNTNT